MIDEKIEISFDDEDKKPENGGKEERLVIDFDAESEESETELIKSEPIEEETPSLQEQILSEKIDSYYKASPGVNSFYRSGIKFPEGIENGFRENGRIELKDTFLNSILESNRYLLMSSFTGSVYAVDRFTKKLKSRLSVNNDSFEKTGLVYENAAYLNSIRSMYFVDENSIENGNTPGAIYTSNPGYYIWSSLNRDKDIIVFLEYSPESGAGNIVMYGASAKSILFIQNFEVRNYLNNTLCILDGKAYFLPDNCLYIMDLNLNYLHTQELSGQFDENSQLFASGNKLYLTDSDGKLYFLENGKGELKYTGICEPYINSCAVFEGNIIIGTESGWKYYNAGGVLVYSHDDVEENKIEAVSNNMLIVSRKNKIIFHNLMRFQEAEGFVIKNEDDVKMQEIFSAVISYNEIFVLTKDGILSSFTNDMLNIHI